ncbi:MULTISPECIES: hypothetical protein [unclassified Microcoleus]|uniref:hypothetical protein n=1 Tax=unclassified Microcoleus TaxID=2642155 RepID=UPI002FD0011A
MENTPFKIAFRQKLTKYITAVEDIDIYNTKIEILNLVDRVEAQEGRKAILEVLGDFWALPVELMQYFVPGSLFEDDFLVFGWYRPDQVRAERLPVKIYIGCDKTFFRMMNVCYNRDGFHIAVALPLSYGPIVSIPGGQEHIFALSRWMAPVALQWYRTLNGLIVYRSIVFVGYCRAWELRADAVEYYAKNPPADLQQILDYDGVPAVDF